MYRMVRNFRGTKFHEFHKKISLRENIIDITAYSVIILFDTFLIREIKKIENPLSQFSPTKIQTIRYTYV